MLFCTTFTQNLKPQKQSVASVFNSGCPSGDDARKWIGAYLKFMICCWYLCFPSRNEAMVPLRLSSSSADSSHSACLTFQGSQTPSSEFKTCHQINVAVALVHACFFGDQSTANADRRSYKLVCQRIYYGTLSQAGRPEIQPSQPFRLRDFNRQWAQSKTSEYSQASEIATVICRETPMV